MTWCQIDVEPSDLLPEQGSVRNDMGAVVPAGVLEDIAKISAHQSLPARKRDQPTARDFVDDLLNLFGLPLLHGTDWRCLTFNDIEVLAEVAPEVTAVSYFE